jgi:hypothetical protein
MPISPFQAVVLRALAANRSPDSYLAGATVLHRAKDTPRYSQDVDFFHDLEDSVAACAEADVATLGEAGYAFSWTLRNPSFHRGVVRKDDHSLKMEWAQDSAFRFFPVQEDEQCGYRLHDADAAINKVLALAGRDEVRDFVDILYLHEHYLSLGAMAWAGCGKDPGFTPDFLLQQTNRHIAYTQSDLDRLELVAPLDLQDMKVKWIRVLEEAGPFVAALPAEELGCLYLDTDRKPVTPDPDADSFTGLIRHHGSIRGAWPTLSR